MPHDQCPPSHRGHTWRALTRADLPRGSIAALEMLALRICQRCDKLGRISNQGVIHVVEIA